MLRRPIVLRSRRIARGAALAALAVCAAACGGQRGAGEVAAPAGDAPASATPENAAPTGAGASAASPDLYQPPSTVDDALRGPLDPAEWAPLATFDGRAVEIRRELDPRGARLMRIHTVLAPEPGQAATIPAVAALSHGPDWRYFETGFPARVEHWLAGELHGPMRAWWPTGQPREEGQYDHGVRVGRWQRHTRDGRLVEDVVLVDGERDGVHRTWFGDGQLEEESHYTLGVLHGRQRRFGRHGKPLLDAHYEHGVLAGQWSDHYPDSGALRHFGAYVAGQKEGPWRTAREDAQGLLLEEVFQAGLRVGLQRTFGPDGQLVSEVEYEADLPHGPSRSWYPDGRPQSEGRHEAGLRVGPWTYWSPDGSVNERWSGTYAADVRGAGPAADPDGAR